MELNFDKSKEKALQDAIKLEEKALAEAKKNGDSELVDAIQGEIRGLNLSFWDKVFFQTFHFSYANNKRGALKTGLKQKIDEELEKCYNNNPFEVEKLHDEYQKVVEYFKNSSYEKSFKALILNVMLAKSFKSVKEKDRSGQEKWKFDKKVDKSKVVKSLNLPEEVIRYIYFNAGSAKSFNDVYDKAMKDSYINKSAVDRMIPVNFEGINTYGLGRWGVFPSKANDEKHFQENYQALAMCVYDTEWCTKGQADMHLKQGDFYLFGNEDEENPFDPRIAIKIKEYEHGIYVEHEDEKCYKIDEIRGRLGNNLYEEIGPSYLKVVINFLENNPQFENRDIWLRHFRNSELLNHYSNQIKAGTFNESEFGNLVYALASRLETAHWPYIERNKTSLDHYFVKLNYMICKDKSFEDKFKKYCNSIGLKYRGNFMGCIDWEVFQKLSDNETFLPYKSNYDKQNLEDYRFLQTLKQDHNQESKETLEFVSDAEELKVIYNICDELGF